MRISLSQAREIIEAMVTFVTEDRFINLKEPGKPFSVAVVDDAGVLVCFARMDGASPASARVSVNKAHTAIDFRRDTVELRDRFFCGDGPLAKDLNRDMAWFGDPRSAPIPGGVLLRDEVGTIVGAVGTSGRTAEEDEELARVGERLYKDVRMRNT